MELAMTANELLMHFADDFGDWIDGDDSVEDYKIYSQEDCYHNIWVKFESGAQFVVSIREVAE